MREKREKEDREKGKRGERGEKNYFNDDVIMHFKSNL